MVVWRDSSLQVTLSNSLGQLQATLSNSLGQFQLWLHLMFPHCEKSLPIFPVVH